MLSKSGDSMGKSSAKKITNLNKVPHPKGRKAAQLSKKTIRAAGREKIKLLHQMKLNLLGEKFMWLKKNLNPVESYTAELTILLIQKYLGRFDEELNQINLKHSVGKRKGRQHANREDIIKMTIKNEKHEYLTCGIEMPDILNSKQLALLKDWSGELRYLQNFKLVRYSKEKLESLRLSTKDNLEERSKSEKLSEENVDNLKPEEIQNEGSSIMLMDVDS